MASFDLTIVVPTYNEALNVRPLVTKVAQELADSGMSWQVLVVDDNSPDKTAEVVRSLAAEGFPCRVFVRIDRRGLSTACIEGIDLADSKYVVVMDGDLQHDISAIPKLYEVLSSENCDLAIGSRYCAGGAVDEWSFGRRAISKSATFFSGLFLGSHVTDPLSGFFAIQKSSFLKIQPKLSGVGFKILLDILMIGKSSLQVKEVPYSFAERERGSTKLHSGVVINFLAQALYFILGQRIPARYLSFVLVGLVGLAVHLLALMAFGYLFQLPFGVTQVLSLLTAMVSNFVLNNKITYRDYALSGFNFFRGLLSFIVACSIGAVINYSVAMTLFEHGVFWVLAGLIGAVIGSIWNFVLSAHFTWRR